MLPAFIQQGRNVCFLLSYQLKETCELKKKPCVNTSKEVRQTHCVYVFLKDLVAPLKL